MKKLLAFVLVASMITSGLAEEATAADGAKRASRDEAKRESSVWPAFLAVGEFPAVTDVVGLRLTIPYSTKQENVTGIDLGLWGHSLYFEGVQINLLRNDVKDDAAGFQVGIYNSVGGGDLLGIQVGLWNEANSMTGFQVGIINVTGETEGFQVGLINRSETMHGYQVGLINVIRDAEVQFMPLLNIGF